MNLDHLEAVARAASDADANEWFKPGVLLSYSRDWLRDYEDAHIAAASPDAVLALIAVARAAKSYTQALDVQLKIALGNLDTEEDIDAYHAANALCDSYLAALRDALKAVDASPSGPSRKDETK